MASDKATYLRQLLALWGSRGRSPKATLVEYLRALGTMAARLPTAQRRGEVGLELFRSLVMKRPDDMRRRLLGANVERVRNLSRSQRVALRVLDVTPDLLSPIGELRYEPAHSRLLAYYMNPRNGDPLAVDLLSAFLVTIGAPAEVMERSDLGTASVVAEALIAEGRADIRIETSALLVLVEMKVDAVEGAMQVERYHRCLEALRDKRTAILVYLTLPGAEAPNPRVPLVHATMDSLLRAWLPFARVDAEVGGHLSRYLKSVALLLSWCGRDAYDTWSYAQQRAVIELVTEMETAQP